MSHRYQPFYCEENVWWLCQAPELAERARWALFVSGAARACMLWEQRAAPPGEPIVWDYHVLLIAEEPSEVWDLDSRLGMPVPFGHYLDRTFRRLPESLATLAPRFRLVPSAELMERFHTDRSHMRTREGGWLAPPPSWEPPRSSEPPNLLRFADVLTPFAGELLSLEQLRVRFSSER